MNVLTDMKAMANIFHKPANGGLLVILLQIIVIVTHITGMTIMYTKLMSCVLVLLFSTATHLTTPNCMVIAKHS